MGAGRRSEETGSGSGCFVRATSQCGVVFMTESEPKPTVPLGRSSCCGGNCGCGTDCKCGSDCGGFKMCPELSSSEKTTAETLVMGVGPVKPSFEGASEMESGAENGCKCGPNCACNPCTCK